MSDLFENILTETYVLERVNAIKEGKQMTWEQIAIALYKILDDIDTLDDACRENSESFRKLVMQTQARKGKYMASFDGMTIQRVDEGWHVYYKDPSQPGQLIKMKKVFPADSAEMAMKQGELLLRREAGPDHEFEVMKAEPVEVEEDFNFTQQVDQLKGIVGSVLDYDDVHFGEGVVRFVGSWDMDYNKMNKLIAQLEELPNVDFADYRGSKGSQKLSVYLQDLPEHPALDKDSDYEGVLGEAIMELVRSFSRQGHSGMSAAMTSEIFNRLAGWKPLSPLTDNPGRVDGVR